ncbi:hypothetical protein Tco_0836190 [Tanacetum coccineum]
MTMNLKLLRNFAKKFMGIVRFENDHFAVITGYGDYVHGNITIFHVYYIEGLVHNLFIVGQFCDGDLKVVFRLKMCYVQNLEGDDLLTGSHESNLYTISVSDIAASSRVYLMSKASSIKSWLWHRHFYHLNFATINQHSKQDVVVGLSKFKYDRIICVPHVSRERLDGPSSNQNPYLVLMKDYSYYIWTYADL